MVQYSRNLHDGVNMYSDQNPILQLDMPNRKQEKQNNGSNREKSVEVLATKQFCSQIVQQSHGMNIVISCAFKCEILPTWCTLP